MSKMATEKRLIDANALLEHIKRRMLVTYPNLYPGLTKAIDIIKNFETEDAVEVVHGQWIPVPSSDMMTGKAYKCSECGKMRYGSYFPNFCQCCGSDMRERKDND